MTRVFVSVVLALLLFSVGAETFSVLFAPGKDPIVLTENDESEKEAQKEKEEKNNDKFSGNSFTLSALWQSVHTGAEFSEPRLLHATNRGYTTLPEQPPRL